MPPAPMADVISYAPIRVPAARVMRDWRIIVGHRRRRRRQLSSRLLVVRRFDRVEKIVQGERAEDLVPLDRVIAVPWIVLHHEPHGSRGTKSFRQGLPPFHSNLIEGHPGGGAHWWFPRAWNGT